MLKMLLLKNKQPFLNNNQNVLLIHSSMKILKLFLKNCFGTPDGMFLDRGMNKTKGDNSVKNPIA